MKNKLNILIWFFCVAMVVQTATADEHLLTQRDAAVVNGDIVSLNEYNGALEKVNVGQTAAKMDELQPLHLVVAVEGRRAEIVPVNFFRSKMPENGNSAGRSLRIERNGTDYSAGDVFVYDSVGSNFIEVPAGTLSQALENWHSLYIITAVKHSFYEMNSVTSDTAMYSLSR